MSPPLPAWRFLRQFPQTQSKFRVVFAGPHFQAALASASEILLGRRKGEGLLGVDSDALMYKKMSD